MWTALFPLAESEISFIQGCPLSGLFLKPMIDSGLQIPEEICMTCLAL
jgi:hypothetical protein